ncbi:hypothetical protein GCM10008090_06260 [Arenicella chitinivorans]|uniref:DUF5808 domain-containing protein n=1 Tax=Arenicella chitinivorans TaxID=1329800 RepID=A0A918RKQ5_9GAMM|nr:hypothetical protein GCM10008090_06260 [Arenicella chitinivorans]
MAESEINQQEWQDERNWVTWFGIYSSRRDSRLWVPKRMPALGWTINFGHPRGPLLFWCILGVLALLVLLAVYL